MQQMTGKLQSAAIQSVLRQTRMSFLKSLTMSALSSHQPQLQALPLLWAVQTGAYTPAIMLQQPLL